MPGSATRSFHLAFADAFGDAALLEADAIQKRIRERLDQLMEERELAIRNALPLRDALGRMATRMHLPVVESEFVPDGEAYLLTPPDGDGVRAAPRLIRGIGPTRPKGTPEPGPRTRRIRL